MLCASTFLHPQSSLIGACPSLLNNDPIARIVSKKVRGISNKITDVVFTAAGGLADIFKGNWNSETGSVSFLSFFETSDSTQVAIIIHIDSSCDQSSSRASR